MADLIDRTEALLCDAFPDAAVVRSSTGDRGTIDVTRDGTLVLSVGWLIPVGYGLDIPGQLGPHGIVVEEFDDDVLAYVEEVVRGIAAGDVQIRRGRRLFGLIETEWVEWRGHVLSSRWALRPRRAAR